MLIKCPECNKEISNQASACPNCGFPLRPNIADTIKATMPIVRNKVTHLGKAILLILLQVIKQICKALLLAIIASIMGFLVFLLNSIVMAIMGEMSGSGVIFLISIPAFLGPMCWVPLLYAVRKLYNVRVHTVFYWIFIWVAVLNFIFLLFTCIGLFLMIPFSLETIGSVIAVIFVIFAYICGFNVAKNTVSPRPNTPTAKVLDK